MFAGLRISADLSVIGFAAVTGQMYVDKSITLGIVGELGQAGSSDLGPRGIAG